MRADSPPIWVSFVAGALSCWTKLCNRHWTDTRTPALAARRASWPPRRCRACSGWSASRSRWRSRSWKRSQSSTW